MLGFHKRDIAKLEGDLEHLKNEHDAWLKRQQN